MNEVASATREVSLSSNPYAPPTAEVDDVAEESLVEPADRGTRFGAAVVDSIITMIIAVPIVIAMFSGIDSSSIDTPPTFDPSLMFGPLGILSFVLALAWIGYTAYLVHKNGQTIGKKLLSIKVVRSDGSRASLARIFWLRNIVNAIPGAIPLLGNLYVLADHLFIFGEKRQCLHDKIADTIVVRA